jgi:hypothetical protein
MPSAAAGDWVLKVSTPDLLGEGTNHFSILALHALGTPPTKDLTVSTLSHLPLFATNPVANVKSKFYLARVQPSTRDRLLDVEFFDLGDSFSGAVDGSLAVTQKNTTSTGPLGNCEYTSPPGGLPDGSSVDPQAPWGDNTVVPSCTFSFNRSNWNGQWVTLHIPIPAQPGYDCDTTRFENCWLQLEVTPNGAGLSDATTWNAQMDGAPVRLVG